MPRTPGSDAAETRRLILQAATNLFMERGYASTSIRDIAEAVGMTKGSLYYHFDSKAEVLEELCKPLIEACERFADRANERPPSPAMIRELIDIFQTHALVMRAMWSDVSTVTRLAAKYNFADLARRMHIALAGADDDIALVRGRCALAAIQGGMVSQEELNQSFTGGPAKPPPIPAVAVDQIVAAAMAVLNSRPEAAHRRSALVR